jgi:hypothetical protein
MNKKSEVKSQKSEVEDSVVLHSAFCILTSDFPACGGFCAL